MLFGKKIVEVGNAELIERDKASKRRLKVALAALEYISEERGMWSDQQRVAYAAIRDIKQMDAVDAAKKVSANDQSN